MQQTELFEITPNDIAGRDETRSIAISRSERAITISHQNIYIRPDFNWRRKKDLSESEWEAKLAIPELAEGIFVSCGPDDPIIGDIIKGGRFIVTEGERRARAITYLINSGRILYPNGKPISEVEVLLNPKSTTELDRIRKIVSSQDKLNLSPMERAYGYAKLKEAPYSLSNEAIGDMFNISRQTVDNYIKATKLPDDVQDKIDIGEIKVTNALLMHKSESNQKKTHGIVNLETGELEDQIVQTIPPVGEQGTREDRLADEAPKDFKEGNVRTETDEANDRDDESRKTDPNFKETRKKSDGQDALGKINDNNQKIDGEIDIEQAIKKLDKAYVLAGQLPNNVKQAKDDLKGIIHFCQELLKQGLDKIKRAPSSVE